MSGSAANGPREIRAWRGYLGLSLAWLAIFGAAFLIMRRPQGRPVEILPPPTMPPAATSIPTPTPGPFHVDVAGAVQSPGVYQLLPGSIVADAIAAAGGPATDADLDRINKAIAVQDGMQVYVPRQGEADTRLLLPLILEPTSATAADPDQVPRRRINVNTASPEELEALPGVGSVIARRIVEGRPYATVEDLVRVDGIGEAKLKEISEYITVQ